MSSKYTVTFDEYTDRHYIKKFQKKYSEKAWSLTEMAIKGLCMNFDELINLEQCDEISYEGSLSLCKLDFAIAGTGKSPKSSGNRCIFVVDKEKKQVRVLLVYHKSFVVKTGSETVAWKKIIQENFTTYRHLV